MDNTTFTTRLAGRAEPLLQRLLVWSPGQRDIIKTVALLLMVADHANRILQLNQEWMFLAGRGAFPLFALVWGQNLSRHAHIRQASVNRLWAWAVIAQTGYFVAGFPWYEGNILFAFAVTAQVMRWGACPTLPRAAGTVMLLVAWAPLSVSSYGLAGLMMLAVSYLLYRAEGLTERLLLAAYLVPVTLALNLSVSGTAALAGLLLTVITAGLVSLTGTRFPRFWPADFFPVFYTCHLVILGVLAL